MEVGLFGKRGEGVRKLCLTFHWLDLREIIALRKLGKCSEAVDPKRAIFDHQLFVLVMETFTIR